MAYTTQNKHFLLSCSLTSIWRLASLVAVDEPEDPDEPLVYCEWYQWQVQVQADCFERENKNE